MDQIADLLIRIKNATMANNIKVVMPHSKIKESILAIFVREGFIKNLDITEEDGKKTISGEISRAKTPSHIKQISKPSRRIYVKSREIPSPLRGLGTVVISTPNGLVTGREAKKAGIGGELICEIW